MTNYKNVFRALMLTGLISVVSSCKFTELDINKDPNRPSSGSLALLMPVAENAAINAYGAVNSSAMGFAGLWGVSDSYNLSNTSFQGTWNSAYQSLQNLRGNAAGYRRRQKPALSGHCDGPESLFNG